MKTTRRFRVPKSELGVKWERDVLLTISNVWHSGWQEHLWRNELRHPTGVVTVYVDIYRTVLQGTESEYKLYGA